MTRFARAKGSKACNDKAPEDGTPWEVMRDQLLQAKKEGEEAKKRQEAENQRIENYENFLKERKVQKRNVTWCDFPEMDQDKMKDNNSIQNGAPNKKKKNNKQHNTGNGPLVANVGQTSQNDSNDFPGTDQVKIKDNNSVQNGVSKKKKKMKNKQNNTENVSISADVGPSIQIGNKPNGISHDNKNKKNNKVNELVEREAGSSGIIQQVPIDQQTKRKKKKKNKQKNQNSADKSAVMREDTSVSENGADDQGDVTTRNKNKKKKKQSSPPENENSSNPSIESENINNKTAKTNKQNKIKAIIKKKDKALVNGKPVRRKEVTERSFQLIINGKEVELVRFDGFPIMKRDAERLGELRQSMLQKGIPKSEVQRTLQLERRRAEKALARMKRDVCYNCRKGGHNLSDCPDLKSRIPGVDAAEGVCFKCGSTEHRQFECKVQREKEFRFATCFICKEPGHIARQCPDNPKGLYPNGGGCKLCGDVTHLRKDCPTINEKKEGSSVKLQTLETTENIEDIGQQKKTTFTEGIKKPKKIKF